MSKIDLTPQQTVTACISNSISAILGRAARAAMREAGKAASNEIWPNLPGKVSPDEAATIMRDGVATLESFGDFMLEPQNDGTFEITFKNCTFARYTQASGAPCGEQAICYFGFGLVEETLRRLVGARVLVELNCRDDENQICYETARPR